MTNGQESGESKCAPQNENVEGTVSSQSALCEIEPSEGEIVEPPEEEQKVLGFTQAELPNGVRLNLQTAGLSVQLDTLSSSGRCIQLAAQVDLLTSQLKEAHDRLELAFRKIGQLESKLEMQSESPHH